MKCSVNDMVNNLSTADVECIQELNRGENRNRIPSPHAERLLEMGLANVEMGHLYLTVSGRRVARMLQR